MHDADPTECTRCGALEHGGRTLAFGTLLGAGMFVIAVWRAELFER
jgi:hypothetical protein